MTAEDGDRNASPRRGWLGRLRDGLTRSRNALKSGLTGIFSGRRVDAATLEELEDLLITADLGPATAARLTDGLRARKFPDDTPSEAVADALAEDIAAILEPVARPLTIDPEKRPHVILVVGVNGVGKTTTIGKLAKDLAQGEDGPRKVMIAAGDTFRAAAVEQLQVWADRAGALFYSAGEGADPAAVSFDAFKAAGEAGADVLLIDTAGRLHNKANLMAELSKMRRVLGKLDPTAPHSTLLVLDATTGQNAHAQAEAFRDMTEVTGLVVTKLDGSARGGVVVALADRFGLPVHAIGVGEGIDDLKPFAARDFARALLGLEA